MLKYGLCFILLYSLRHHVINVFDNCSS
jgi:hypothetical protein